MKITDLICEWTIELYFRKRSHFNDREARKGVYPTIRMGEFCNLFNCTKAEDRKASLNTTCLCLRLFYGVKCIHERDRFLWWRWMCINVMEDKFNLTMSAPWDSEIRYSIFIYWLNKVRVIEYILLINTFPNVL